MKFFKLLFTVGLIFFSSVAYANGATVNNNGQISISGTIDTVNKDSFILLYDDERIEVSMDGIKSETIDQLIETNIIKSGSYVTVTGKMKDGLINPVIMADTIDLLAQ